MPLTEFHEIILREKDWPAFGQNILVRENYRMRKMNRLRNFVMSAIMGFGVATGVGIANSDVEADRLNLANLEAAQSSYQRQEELAKTNYDTAMESIGEECRLGVALFMPGGVNARASVDEAEMGLKDAKICGDQTRGFLRALRDKYEIQETQALYNRGHRDRIAEAREDVEDYDEVISGALLGIVAGAVVCAGVFSAVEEFQTRYSKDIVFYRQLEWDSQDHLTRNT